MTSTHPFGRENEVSIDLLLRFFCNNVNLGQWELARACVADLHNQNKLSSVQIKEVLESVGKNPYGYCEGSTTVQDQNALSWLAYLEYKDIEDDLVQREWLRQDIEFRLLLAENSADASQDVLQDLYKYHRRALDCKLSINRSENRVAVPFMHQQTQLFISNTLSVKPLLGYSLIHALRVEDHPLFLENNSHLIRLHLGCLQTRLLILNRCLDLPKEFLELLSLFEPSDVEFEELRVNDFLRDLSEFVERAGFDILSQIYSKLIGKSSTVLLDKFSVIHSESQRASTSHGYSLMRKTPNGSSSQFPATTPHQISYIDLYWSMLRHERHFLETVVHVSLDYVRQGNLQGLSDLMSVQEWQPLRPLVLLLAWDLCPHPDVAKQLLNVLHDPSEEADSVLSGAGKHLAHQIDLLQWCLDRAQSLGHREEERVSLYHTPKMLHNMEMRSVLQMLHHCGLLSSLDQTEVFDMLSKMPSGSLKESLKAARKEKTVRFADEESELLKSDSKINIAQEKDIAIYRSYCALKNFIDALKFCKDNTHWQVFCRQGSIRSKNSRPTFCMAGFSDALNCILKNEDLVTLQADLSMIQNDMQDLQKLYDKKVTKLLREGLEHISKLLPLNYRVELLEDVFALLFTTYEDLQESSQSDSGEEGITSSRNTSQQTSRENLSSVGSVTSEVAPDGSILSTTESPIHGRSGSASPPSPSAQSTVEPSFSSAAKALPSLGLTPDTSNKAKLFSIKKSELQDCQLTKRDKKISGNLSANSTNSLLASSNVGFVANEFFIRDLLAVLKICMVEVTQVRFALQGQSKEDASSLVNVEMDKVLRDSLQSSVAQKDLQSRISRLQQCISEAQWRFQLVAHDWLPSEVGNVIVDLNKLKDQQLLDDEIYISVEDNNRKRKRRRKSNSKQESEDGAQSACESESLIGTTDDSMAEPCSPRLRKRKSSKTRTSTAEVLLEHLSKIGDGVIHDMLLPPEDLLSSCLKRGKFVQAEQIIKMFRMQDSQAAGEATFAVQFLQAVKKLQGLNGKSRLRRSLSTPAQAPSTRGKLSLLKPSLSVLADVAAAGIQTSSASVIVDQLLSLNNLPKLGVKVSKGSPGESAPLTTLSSDAELAVIIILDLACSSCRSWESSLNLLEMAMVRRQCQSSPTENRDQPKSMQSSGIEVFLDNLVQLVKLGSEVPESDVALQRYYSRSIIQILTTGSLPLQTFDITLLHNATKKLGLAMTSVARTYADLYLQNATDILQETSKPTAGNKSVVIQTKPALRLAMKQLVKTAEESLPCGGMTDYMLRFYLNSKDVELKSHRYFGSLYSYVKLVSSIIHNIQNDKPKPGQLLCVEYFKVLDQSPTEIFGKLMFHWHVPPSRVEKEMGDMKISLPQVILNASCPKLQIDLPLRKSTVLKSYPEVFGRRLLNNGSVHTENVKHPENLVRELLTRLVILLKERSSMDNPQGFFTLDVAKTLVNDPQLQDILTSTREIRLVDLGLLADREQKLSFYGNLVNLMTFHVWIAAIQDHMKLFQREYLKNRFGTSVDLSLRSVKSLTVDDSSLDLKSMLPSSELDWILHEDKWAYKVGQLGLVSLFELKYIILRAGLPPPTRYSNLVQARCCDIDVNDPWYIYGPPMESRLTFVLAEGHISSPPLQVLSPEMVTTQLRRSLREYLHCSVYAEMADKLVILPQLLVWYKTDFVSEGRKDAKEFESLLEFVSSQVEEGISSDLHSLMDSYGSSPKTPGKSKSDHVQVHVNRYSTDFGVTFDFDQFKACQPQHPGTHRRCSSLQFNPSMLTAFSASGGNHKSDMNNIANNYTPRSERATFDLTQPTLEYLANSSGDLIAALASLVSNDGAEDSAQTNVTLQYTEDSLSASSAVIIETLPTFAEFIKTFRQEKLIQFLPLQQHLRTHLSPLDNAIQSVADGDIVNHFSQTSLKESTRKALLVPPSHESYTSLARTVLRESTGAHKWDEAVTTLLSLPQSVCKSNNDFVHFHDFILFCASQLKDDTDFNRRARYSLAIINPLCRVRSVLGILSDVTIEVALHLLRSCESAFHPEDLISKTLQMKLKHFSVYEKIIVSTKTQLSRLTGASSKPMLQTFRVVQDYAEDHHLLHKLATWQGIISQSEEDPDSVLDIILQSHDFKTARDWANIHNVRKELFQIIEEKFISYLLEKGGPDYLQAYRVLESLKAESWETCLKVCEDLLKNLIDKQNVLYVAQFMLDQLDGDSNERSFSPSRVSHLNLLILGCKMLLHLPSEMRGLYEHLIASPVLMLEQLLMNMKVEYVGKMLKSMQMEIKAAGEEEFCISACDSLFVTYATKALEFPVCKSYDSSTEVDSTALSRSHSRASLVSLSTSSATQPTIQTGTPSASTPKHIHATSRLSLSSSTDDVSRFGPKNLTTKMSRSESNPTFSPHKVAGSPVALVLPPSSQTAHSPGTLTPGRKLMTATSRGYSISPQVLAPPPMGFIMPPEPPHKNQWVPDEAVSLCMVCQTERFSMFNRRHHCRRCGRVVCGNCSAHTTPIRGFSARACDDCYSQIYKTRSDSHKRNNNSPATDPHVSRLEEIPESPETMVGFSTEYQYILVLDDELNEATRDEFYYDQAPSTSLCLSILDLLSDRRGCGQKILSLVDEMSKLLQPLAPGVKNHEVDYSLVISMLKYLLFHAKVKLQKHGDNAGVELCDQYLGRLDLLKLLVMDNYPYIPSMQQLTKFDSLRRLRDKLIEEERLSLAMEVSTKCGIDPAGVWAAWGMTCLCAGDLNVARDKFSKCLKTPKDKNQSGGQLKLLADIVDYLENHLNSSVESVLSPLTSMTELLADPPQIRHEDGQIDEVIMQECLYYLRKYGNHLSIVSFYMKHRRLSTAINYCKEMKVAPDVFVEGVMITALQNGQVSKVLDILSHTDPSLESWTSQLNATCRHLNKNKLIHSLYNVQVFMKDFIRAAMTCITYFYQGGATSYSDLSTRVHHLLSAKQHLESYLDDHQWGTILRAPGGGVRTGRGDKHPDTLRMIMTPGEVNKYVNTINLQMEVTKFLQRYYENLDVVMTSLPARGTGASASASYSRTLSRDAGLPTLFGSTKTKTEVVLLVLLSGNNINDGFGLAFRIIQDFKLDSTSIYIQAARYLGNLQQYSAVKQLLSCIQDSGLCTDQAYDEVVTGAIEVIGHQASEGKEVEQLIKMIRSDSKRVHAYIKCGKLKSAYLIAVKKNDESAIRLISRYADKLGQSAVKSICDKWLQQKENN